MKKVLLVTLTAMLAVILAVGTSASASQSGEKFTVALQLQLKAPTTVRPLVTYRNNHLTVTNNTSRNWGKVKLTMTPASVLVKSGSTPFKVSHLAVYGPQKTAYWLISSLPAHSTRSVRVALRFPTIPNDVLPVFGINIEGQVLGGGPFNHIFVTMHYKKGAR